jgi:membrane fusion protein, multidrug efflux system
MFKEIKIMNATLRILLTLAIQAIAILAISGCGNSNGKPAAKDSAGRGGKIPVDAVIIKAQPLENKIYTTGTLLANEEVELRPEIAGRVIGVYFAEGSRVKKGQLLIKINDRELKAQLESKQLAEKLAADDEKRKKGLFDINGISREEYDKAVNALKMVQADEEIIRSQIAETEIIAPFDGVVGLRYISEGSYVIVNQLTATMQDIDPIKIEFSVPEKYARLIKDGTTIVALVGDDQNEHQGKVYALESKIDSNTRTMKVRAKIPNADGTLIPGSFARIELVLEQIPDAIVIPAEAVVPELNGEKVFIAQNGKARATPITSGIRTENSIQVVAGLSIDDTLLVTGLLQLGDGRAVDIKNIRGNQ